MSDLDWAGAELGLVCYLSRKINAMGERGDAQGHQLEVRLLRPRLGDWPKTWLGSGPVSKEATAPLSGVLG